MRSYELWTDGACSGSPGVGGWAAILAHDATKLALSGWEPSTTSNRMELTAVVKGLQAVGAAQAVVVIHTDSAYVKNAFTRGWVLNWQSNGWRGYRGDPVANRDLWEQLIAEVARHVVSWVKVKGHARAHSLNTVADALAVSAKTRKTDESSLLP